MVVHGAPYAKPGEADGTVAYRDLRWDAVVEVLPCFSETGAHHSQSEADHDAYDRDHFAVEEVEQFPKVAELADG